MRPHGNELPNAVSGERTAIETPVGTINIYSSDTGSPSTVRNPRPLVLIHSINAAGSSYEVRPIYEHFAKERPVFAIDLPGFGFSDRSDRPYTPRLMTDAIHAAVDYIFGLFGEIPLDALAVSLSSEFLARAASERPEDFRTLAFISPTGFDRRAPYTDAPGSTRANPTFYRVLRFPLWDERFFRLLTSRWSIRYFLEKTWGSKNIDEGMLDYDYATTHQTGARFAPYYFVSGYLFSGDITTVHESLIMPIWLSHGVKGDFQDYSFAETIKSRGNWTVTTFQTGALPHFEARAAFLSAYSEYLSQATARQAPAR